MKLLCGFFRKKNLGEWERNVSQNYCHRYLNEGNNERSFSEQEG
jgi:hypothetical protein